MDLSGWLDQKAKVAGVGRFRPYNMRYVSLESWPANEKPPRCTAANRVAAMTRVRDEYLVTCPFRSIGLFRLLLQQQIDRDIRDVLQRYHRQFLEPVLANVRKNLGPDSSLAEQLDGNAFMHQVLDEAKKLFPVPEDNPCLVKLRRAQTDHLAAAESNGTVGTAHPGDGPPAAAAAPCRPRGRPSKKAASRMKAKASKTKRKRRAVINSHHHNDGTKASTAHDSKNNDATVSGGDDDADLAERPDPSRLTTNTLFVLGSKANKALGFGAARGRLYSKHSNLFRYIGDHEDKEWLHRNQLMPPTGGKAYLLLRQDIVRLIESDEYRGLPGVNVANMGQGFTVPQSMVDKIIATMQTKVKSIPTSINENQPPTETGAAVSSSTPPSSSSSSTITTTLLDS